jgi:hypothetical protein
VGVDRRGNNALQVLELRHVRDQALHPAGAWERSGNRRGIVTHIAQRNVRAGTRQGRGKGSTQPRRSTGDNCRAAAEINHQYGLPVIQ